MRHAFDLLYAVAGGVFMLAMAAAIVGVVCLAFGLVAGVGMLINVGNVLAVVSPAVSIGAAAVLVAIDVYDAHAQ